MFSFLARVAKLSQANDKLYLKNKNFSGQNAYQKSYLCVLGMSSVEFSQNYKDFPETKVSLQTDVFHETLNRIRESV